MSAPFPPPPAPIDDRCDLAATPSPESARLGRMAHVSEGLAVALARIEETVVIGPLTAKLAIRKLVSDIEPDWQFDLAYWLIALGSEVRDWHLGETPFLAALGDWARDHYRPRGRR
jgi:hypothetical protein